VAVNAPEAGTIKEFLVNEEDTVTVGQDIVKLEAGGEPSGGKKQEAKDEVKEPASKEQETSSQPEGQQEQSQPKEESKPQPPKKESKPKQEETKPATPGSREERRVRLPYFSNCAMY
jgi:2-oxoglutarate dehydrogenase E2 component (dihydrolipoamide succinyltransferase)